MAISLQNNNFTLSLIRSLSEKDSEGNLFLSPYSISSAFHMLLLGANGNTKQQVLSALGYCLQSQIDDTKLHLTQADASKKLSAQLKNVTLENANRLFPGGMFSLIQQYVKDCEKFYTSTVKPLDYKNDTEKSRQEINTWVEEKTKGKITNLIPPGILTSMTELVIANAVYFKGNWVNKFNPGNTKDGKFHISASSSKSTKFMHLSEKMNYHYLEDLKAYSLSLYYQGRGFRMVILLPDEKFGIHELQKKLTSQHLENTFRRLRQVNKEKVNLSLPKFKFEQSFNLNDTMEKMGVTDAFSSRADFSSMFAPPGKVIISQVLHKAFIEVNEEGSEAAAATAVVMSRMMISRPVEPVDIVCDHPFLFFIQHDESGAVMFAGRYSKPE